MGDSTLATDMISRLGSLFPLRDGIGGLPCLHPFHLSVIDWLTSGADGSEWAVPPVAGTEAHASVWMRRVQSLPWDAAAGETSPLLGHYCTHHALAHALELARAPADAATAKARMMPFEVLSTSLLIIRAMCESALAAELARLLATVATLPSHGAGDEGAEEKLLDARGWLRAFGKATSGIFARRVPFAAAMTPVRSWLNAAGRSLLPDGTEVVKGMTHVPRSLILSNGTKAYIEDVCVSPDGTLVVSSGVG